MKEPTNRSALAIPAVMVSFSLSLTLPLSLSLSMYIHIIYTYILTYTSIYKYVYVSLSLFFSLYVHARTYSALVMPGMMLPRTHVHTRGSLSHTQHSLTLELPHTLSVTQGSGL